MNEQGVQCEGGSKKRGGPYMPTPIVYGDLLYTCSNQGVVTAYNVDTGERIYQERLAGKGGAFTASPVASDGKIYLSSEDGEIFVVKAGPKHELLATNAVGAGLAKFSNPRRGSDQFLGVATRLDLINYFRIAL